MGTYYNGVHISGNFTPLTKLKPKNWIETGYKIIVPYKFKWRHKIGKVECDCKTCEEHFQPYYGIDFFHAKGCAYVEIFMKRPQLLNLIQYSQMDIRLITSTD